MKKVILVLGVALAQIAQADVSYPDQNEIPTLKCKYNSVEFTLAAPKMIWEKEMNTRWPEYNGYSGEVEVSAEGRLAQKMQFKVSYTDNAATGKNISFLAKIGENYHWNLLSYEVETFVAVKSFNLTFTTIDDHNPEIYNVECKRLN